MSHRHTRFIVPAMVLALVGTAHGVGSSSADEGWALVWSDEFDGERCPDPKNWTYETGFVRNNESQWYQPQNAACRDGLLVIEGEWPDGGEIDMMEFYQGVLLANVAWGTGKRWVPEWDSVRTPVATLGEGWADRFHVWRMDWDADAIRLYVDDRLLNETSL